METPKQTVIVTSAVVAAVVVAGILAWLWFGSSSDTPVVENPIDTATPTTPVTGSDLPIGDGAFNLNVLQRSGYKALDLSPIQNGQLPIKPPATTGKANPFL